MRCEEAERLSRVLPKELVEELPVFISGDIYLPDKLEDILTAKPQAVLCGAQPRLLKYSCA